MTTFVDGPAEGDSPPLPRTDPLERQADELRFAIDRLANQLSDDAHLDRRHETILVGDVLALDGRLADLEDRLTGAGNTAVAARMRSTVTQERARFEELRVEVLDRVESAPDALTVMFRPEAASTTSEARSLLGTVLTAVGVLLVAFVLFQLLVTPVIADRAQRELAGEFGERLDVAASLATVAGGAATGGQSSLGPGGFAFDDIDPDRPEIPELRNELPGDAAIRLEELGFEVVRAPQPSRELIPGLVTGTSPPAGSTFEIGGEVTIFVSTLAKGSPVAALTVPAIGISEIVVEGTTSENLMSGPGHYRDSPLPGQPGNAVLFGRRTTYGGPFSRLGELEPGDEVGVVTLASEFTYEVIETKIVRTGEEDVLSQDDRNLLTLVSANPEYRASERLVVVAELQGDPVGGVRQTEDGDEVGQATVLSSDELGRHRDTTAWGPALLWGELLLVALMIAWLLYRRWRRWATWMLTTPVIAMFAILLFESVTRLLPSTL